MANVFKKIIQYHICKADRILTDNTSLQNFEEKFYNINYLDILDIQNQVSNDDSSGFIWVLNSSILLVPDYNLDFIKE